ncbi:efflux RND transporter permease subunit [Cereibacter sphaeroides]|uniref:efflux RND transporter permease subunit n=1 Tax=Cereibacter sphaeroides TaxID=1063 RepID=UPI0022A6D6F0|nr:efflux RND transporter permease subunit [Cereibacter sphaeroides]
MPRLQSAADPGPVEFGRFRGLCADRAGHGIADLAQVTQKLVAAAATRPELARVRTTLDVNAPQMRLDLNTTPPRRWACRPPRCSRRCGPQSAAFTSMSHALRPQLPCELQSEAPFRGSPDDTKFVFFRSESTDKMIPLSALVRAEPITGPDQGERISAFTGAKIMGNAIEGEYASVKGI